MKIFMQILQFTVPTSLCMCLLATAQFSPIQEVRVLKRALLSPMMCAAASRGDTSTLRELQEEVCWCVPDPTFTGMTSPMFILPFGGGRLERRRLCWAHPTAPSCSRRSLGYSWLSSQERIVSAQDRQFWTLAIVHSRQT